MVNTGIPGKHGGTLHSLVGRSRDTRLLVVYGYARLVGYDRNLELVPDILGVIRGRTKGASSPSGCAGPSLVRRPAVHHRGLPLLLGGRGEQQGAFARPGRRSDLLVDGKPPKFEVLSETDGALHLEQAQPALPAARRRAPSPLFIYRPAHYLKPFHKKYSEKVSKADADGTAKRRWSAVHNRADNLYESDNPDLPTLQPWMNTTRPPADRFVAVRNPYFHRVDQNGQQLPYIDRFVLAVADPKLIPAKTGAGEADLQARDLHFNNYTFLKQGEKQQRLPHAALAAGRRARISRSIPNLNVNDPVWRAAAARRALPARAVARHRPLARQQGAVFRPGASRRTTPCCRRARCSARPYRDRWARYDNEASLRLLDEIGLEARP